MRISSLSFCALLSLSSLLLIGCGDDEDVAGAGGGGGSGNADNGGGGNTGNGGSGNEGNGGSGNDGSGGFVQDTCSGGENMTDPRLSEPFDPHGVPAELLFEWDRGTGKGALLPDAYFEQVEVDPFTTQDEVTALVMDVSAVAPGQIRVRFDDLTGYRANNDELTLVLLFPDRRDFIECTHPGMEDRYLLTIDVDWTLDPVWVELSESVQFGAI